MSWSLAHKEAVKGTIAVGFYDDEGATTLRKVRCVCDHMYVANLTIIILTRFGGSFWEVVLQ